MMTAKAISQTQGWTHDAGPKYQLEKLSGALNLPQILRAEGFEEYSPKEVSAARKHRHPLPPLCRAAQTAHPTY